MDKMDEMKLLTDATKKQLMKLIEDGLQFVDKSQDILCNNCGRIPLFHYIYPCLHPYCQDCYVNVCVQLKKKCRVCKTDIATTMLQSKILEAAIYKLKAICPNKLFGCNDEIELNKLLDHLSECKHSKEKPFSVLCKKDRDLNYESTSGHNDFKACVESIQKIVSGLAKRDGQFHEQNKRLTEDNLKLTVEVQELIRDVRMLKRSNVSINRQLEELKEQKKNDLKEPVSAISKDFELVSQKLQKLSDTMTEMEPNVEKKVAVDVTDMQKLINESKQLLKNIHESNNIKLDHNGQLLNKHKITVAENKRLANDNKELAHNNLKTINLIEKLLEDNKKIADMNEKCMVNYRNLKIDCKTLNEVSNYEFKNVIKNLERKFENEFRNHNEALESIKKKTFSSVKLSEEKLEKMVFDSVKLMNTNQEEREQNTKKIDVMNNNVDVLAKLINSSGEDMVQILQSQKDSMGVITAMKVPKNGVLIWEINEFSKKKEMACTSSDEKIDICSDEFYSSEYGYKMNLNVEFQKDQLGVFLGFVPGEHDAHLPAVFHHERTFCILDQSDRKEKRNVVGVNEPRFRDGQPARWMKIYYGFSIFCTYSFLETKHKDVYLKDDRIFLKVVVEPIFPLTRSPFSHNGILIWKVKNYSRTKQESQDKICEYFESESFYSSTHGYRMKCLLHFGENHFAIWLFFLDGEFDDSLPDVYAHKVTFSILDQNGNSGNNLNEVATFDLKVIGDEKKARKRMRALSCSVVNVFFADFEKTSFLVNNSILIKVDVKPI